MPGAGRAEAHGGEGGWRPPWALGGFLAAVAAASTVNRSMTLPNGHPWVQGLGLPWYWPPDWAFGAAWTTILSAAAVAGWLVWRERRARPRAARAALALWAVQLALNVLWVPLFFELRSPTAALAELAALWAVVAATIVACWRVRPLAGALFAPYLAWLTFAAALNAAVAA